MLGVRSTALTIPPALNCSLLADRICRPANKIVMRGQSGCTPSQLDLQTQSVWGRRGLAYEVASAPLEYIILKDVFSTPRNRQLASHICCSIYSARCGNYFLHGAWESISILAKFKNGCWELAHEDAGYLLADKNTDPWLNRLPNSGRLLGHSDDYLLIDASFHQASHEQLTPTKQLILRFLNFTVLRFQRLGDIFRQLLVARLAGNRKPLPATLLRKIEFKPHSIYVIDRFQGVANLTRQQARAPLWRCRRVTSNHMASARYYQDIEGNLSAP